MEKRELYEEDFYKIICWQTEQDRKNIFHNTEDIQNTIEINDCIINIDSGDYKDLNFEHGLKFTNCEFIDEELFFENCKFSSYYFENCDFYSSIKFSNSAGVSHFRNSNFYSHVTFERFFDFLNIEINKCVFKDKLIFHKIAESRQSEIEISETSFEKEVLFSGVFKSRIILKNNTFLDNLTLGEKSRSFNNYKRLSRFKSIKIESGEFKKRIVFNKIQVEEKIWMTNTNIFIDTLEVQESIFMNEFVIAHCSINFFTVYGGKFFEPFKTNFAKIKELYITGGKFTQIEIKEGYLEKFHVSSFHEIDNLRLSERILYISNLIITQSNPIKILIKKNIEFDITETSLSSWSAIKSISFKNSSLHKDSVVQFYDLELREVQFNYYLNLGNIVFNNVEFYSRGANHKKFRLSIVNSDLGKTSFIDCKSTFPMFDELEFSNSKLLDSFFSNNVLPENIIYPKEKIFRNNSIIGRSIRIYEQKEILYNQLKKISENKSDISSSIYNKAKSHDAQRRILTNKLFGIINSGIRPAFVPKLLTKYFNALFSPLFFAFTIIECLYKKEKRREFFEWITLSINQLSNNHGSSWQRGLLVTIIIILGLYSYYCKLSGFEIGNWQNLKDKNLFFELFSHIGNFLNPIPKDDTYEKFYPNDDNINFPKARLFEILSKIIISYFVFQTIQAFRRFGK